MKKILFSIMAVFLSAGFCYAQKGNNQVAIGVEADLPLGSYSGYNVGFGGNLKGLYGLGSASQLTLTAGYSSFSAKSGGIYNGQTLTLLPILAGYRYNLASGLYGEGQVGLATLTTKIPGFSFSQTNFAAAINVGYVIKGFDVSVRYYTEGDVMSMFALRLAYNISLGKK
jgi:hypothetical protein